MAEQQAPTLQEAWEQGYKAGFSDLAEPDKVYTIRNPKVNPYEAAKNIDTASPSPASSSEPLMRKALQSVLNDIRTSVDGLRYETIEQVIAALATPQPSPTGPREGEPRPNAETWIVVKEHAWDHGDGGRPTLAYLWPLEFPAFSTYDEAMRFRKERPELPPGWVVMAAHQRRAAPETATPSLPPQEPVAHVVVVGGRATLEWNKDALQRRIWAHGKHPLYAAPSLPAVLTDATCRDATVEAAKPTAPWPKGSESTGCV